MFVIVFPPFNFCFITIPGSKPSGSSSILAVRDVWKGREQLLSFSLRFDLIFKALGRSELVTSSDFSLVCQGLQTKLHRALDASCLGVRLDSRRAGLQLCGTGGEEKTTLSTRRGQ